MYDLGLGVPQDYAEALKWYRTAAEQGDADAQYNLGVMYERGRGVLQSDIKALMWYGISAANGLELGSESRDRIAKRMTSAEIEEAQRLAMICMNSNYQDCDE